MYLCFLASVVHGSMRDFVLFLFACVKSNGTDTGEMGFINCCVYVRKVRYCTVVITVHSHFTLTMCLYDVVIYLPCTLWGWGRVTVLSGSPTTQVLEKPVPPSSGRQPLNDSGDGGSQFLIQ